MNLRKPFIVEFTGTPEAGKTTVIKHLHERLIKLGYKVKIYPESAENSPSFFPKGCIEAKLWINFDITKHVLEAPHQTDYDIILFDRGTIDNIFWMHLDSIYNPEVSSKSHVLKDILTNYYPDFLITLSIPVEETIKRRGGEGRLVTREFVTTYNRLFKCFINSLQINKVNIPTENKSIEEVVNITTNYILENLKSHS